jgi:hypothetical protein
MVREILQILRKVVKITQSNKNPLPEDMEAEFSEIYSKCSRFSMTSPERMYAMYKAVEYVSKFNIEGDIVECGVWKGGSSMIGAIKLSQMNDIRRKIYLYDTYEGMSEPTEKDVGSSGKPAWDKWEKNKKENGNDWCYASLDEVRENLLSTGYPEEKLVFVKGKVENTIPKQVPEKISVLRLDTDWYESTYHEMVYLFPLLSPGGVLILDDYGYWKGAREAVDQYLSENNQKMFIVRIDKAGRIGIKI